MSVVPRLLLIAAILAGTSYIGSWFLELPPAASVIWTGAGVALLAAYAASQARGLDGWLLAMVMAAREIAKMCGFYAADRKVVAVELSPKSRSTMAQFEAMSDDQLIAIIEAPDK